jgi:hypothetical protein
VCHFAVLVLLVGGFSRQSFKVSGESSAFGSMLLTFPWKHLLLCHPCVDLVFSTADASTWFHLSRSVDLLRKDRMLGAPTG